MGKKLKKSDRRIVDEIIYDNKDGGIYFKAVGLSPRVVGMPKSNKLIQQYEQLPIDIKREVTRDYKDSAGVVLRHKHRSSELSAAATATVILGLVFSGIGAMVLAELDDKVSQRLGYASLSVGLLIMAIGACICARVPFMKRQYKQPIERIIRSAIAKAERADDLELLNMSAADVGDEVCIVSEVSDMPGIDSCAIVCAQEVATSTKQDNDKCGKRRYTTSDCYDRMPDYEQLAADASDLSDNDVFSEEPSQHITASFAREGGRQRHPTR